MVHRLAVAAAVLGAIGVALGAFGAHAMKARLSPDLLAAWDAAVRYQVWHALAALGASLFALHAPGARTLLAGWLFIVGAVVFAGSLYLMAATGLRGFGVVTPVGGVLLVAGWLALARGLLKAPRGPARLG